MTTRAVATEWLSEDSAANDNQPADIVDVGSRRAWMAQLAALEGELTRTRAALAAALVTRDAALGHVHAFVEGSLRPALLCDRELRIQYANPAARHAFAGLAAELSPLARELIGETLEVLYPGFVVDERTLPALAHVPVGRRTLELELHAARDASGAIAGVVVTWSDVTARTAAAARRDQALFRASTAIDDLREAANIVDDLADELEARAPSSQVATGRACARVLENVAALLAEGRKP